MRLPGRVSAAIEILTEIMERHRPASEALRDWGKAHRFAGGGDRHAIGTLVYDALRQKNSAAFRMGSDTPRALVLGTLCTQWHMTGEGIAALTAEDHGPVPLSKAERSAIDNARAGAEPHEVGNFPQWLTASLKNAFGDNAAAEGAALAGRAPIDLRVNTLRATRAQVLEALQRYAAVAGPLSPGCVRIAAPGHDQKHINVEAETYHGMGWFEVQDAASQVAALLTGAKAGELVADICAGAGGKTLALAAQMNNQGRIVAHDRDKRRLRPIFERINRAGAGNIDVLAAEDGGELAKRGGFDCVVVDAPCSGTGTWRRKPDAKWKFSPKLLAMRQDEQRDVLARGATLVKPGGRLAYFTCSVLPDENTDQVKLFLSANSGFRVVPYAEQWKRMIGGKPPVSADGAKDTLLLTPRQHGTDGFFVAVLEKTR
jgi:16S rRNA (cytosine967-C5)-methyltransferase